MAYYFLYRAKNTPEGGIVPNTCLLPQGTEIELGLTEREGFYLGRCNNPEDVLPIVDYIVTFIDEETAQGFQLLGVSQLPENPDDPESPLRDLTPEEQALQNKAYNLVLKLKVRQKIYAEVSDLEDIIADLSKRVDLIERLVVRCFNFILQDQPIPDELKQAYLPLVQRVIEVIDVEGVRTRIDVEDPVQILERLKDRVRRVTDIVKTEYLDRKR